MRPWLLVPLSIVALGGCIPDYATVEEACDGKVPGAGKYTGVALDVFGRINCYRRTSKLTRARMDPKVQDEAENHIAYMAANVEDYLADPYSHPGFFTEVAGEPGFTGADYYERLEEAGSAYGAGATDVWLYEFYDDQKAEERIDFWFPEPSARQAYMQLGWIAGGYDEVATPEGVNMAYLTILYNVPINDRVGLPYTFPRDGQEDVPTTFEALDPNTFAYGLGPLGYPITIGVGATSSAGGSNPHELSVRSASLTGPEGDIPLLIETPADGHLSITVAFYPETPLSALADYTLEADVEWIDNGSKLIVVNFTTGSDPSPHGPWRTDGRVELVRSRRPFAPTPIAP